MIPDTEVKSGTTIRTIGRIKREAVVDVGVSLNDNALRIHIQNSSSRRADEQSVHNVTLEPMQTDSSALRLALPSWPVRLATVVVFELIVFERN